MNYRAGEGPLAIRGGIFNRDGDVDLAVCAGASAEVLVFPGNGQGAFGKPWAFPTGSDCNSIAVGDPDGSGRDDIVAATANGVVVLLNSSS